MRIFKKDRKLGWLAGAIDNRVGEVRGKKGRGAQSVGGRRAIYTWGRKGKWVQQLCSLFAQ